MMGDFMLKQQPFQRAANGRSAFPIYRELVEAEAAVFVASLTPDAALVRTLVSQRFGSSGRKSRLLAKIYITLNTASKPAPQPFAAAA